MTYLPDTRVKWLVVHYSATPIERETSYAEIEAGHKARGFSEFGYHAYGPRKGGWLPGRDLSRPGAFEMGAHSKGENDEALGYCYEGGVRLSDMNTGFDSRTPEQVEAMIDWIDEQLARFGGDGIDPSKGPVVEGHQDMPGAATQCPGFDAAKWWAEVVKERNSRFSLPKLIASILKGLFK